MTSPRSTTARPSHRALPLVLSLALLALAVWAAWPGASESLVVVVFGEVPPSQAATVRQELGRFYHLPTRSAPPPSIVLPRAPNGRVDANALIDVLEAQPMVRGERWLLLCDQDGTASGLNFVFGLARRPGRAAVVFLPRLTANATPELAAERIRKVTRHETGHMFGLDHCDQPQCVMAFSNNAGALGVTTDELCPQCGRRLARWRWVQRRR